MDKKLSIVIPYYEEGKGEIFPLLSSINNQAGINFRHIECILVNDGNNNRLPADFINMFYNLDIKRYYMKENRGPGVARQYGIDHAKGKYIMFCDADDVIYSVGALGSLMQELDKNDPDILVSDWMEECFREETKEYIYILQDNESTWMHGKVFKMDYLQKNNIRFHEKLRVHEDSYFLSLAFELSEHKMKMDLVTYLWKWRKNSITRKNDGIYSLETLSTFNYSVAESLKEIIRRGLTENIPYRVVQMVIYTYFSLHQDYLQRPEHQEYRQQAEESLYQFFYPLKHYFDIAGDQLIREVYKQEREKHFDFGIEEETFTEWLKRIGFMEKSKTA